MADTLKRAGRALFLDVMPEPASTPAPAEGEARPRGLLAEFRLFLENYKVIGLAIAFIIGAALNTLVKSIVDGLVMPLVTPILPGGDWRSAEATVGPFEQIRYGAVLADLIYFLVIAAFVFLVAKYLLRDDPSRKR